MCAAPHVCLREGGWLDGYKQIIAHRGREETETIQRFRKEGRTQRKRDCRKKNRHREEELKEMKSNNKERRKLELRVHTRS